MSENTDKKARRTVTWNDKFTVMTFDLLTAKTFTFNMDTLSTEMLHRLAAHGLEQKLRDNLARGKSETLTDAEAMKETLELAGMLVQGEWSKKKSSTPSVKLSDLEAKFIEAVKNGTMTPEAMKSMYTTLTGKPWILGDDALSAE